MAASDTSDKRELKLNGDGGGQTAMIRSAKGVDIIGGAVDGVKTTGDLATDAAAASVSLSDASDPGTIHGYAMAGGKSLDYRSTSLVQADQNVHVINDGSKLIVRGAGRCQRFLRPSHCHQFRSQRGRRLTSPRCWSDSLGSDSEAPARVVGRHFP